MSRTLVELEVYDSLLLYKITSSTTSCPASFGVPRIAEYGLKIGIIGNFDKFSTPNNCECKRESWHDNIEQTVGVESSVDYTVNTNIVFFFSSHTKEMKRTKNDQ